MREPPRVGSRVRSRRRAVWYVAQVIDSGSDTYVATCVGTSRVASPASATGGPHEGERGDGARRARPPREGSGCRPSATCQGVGLAAGDQTEMALPQLPPVGRCHTERHSESSRLASCDSRRGARGGGCAAPGRRGASGRIRLRDPRARGCSDPPARDRARAAGRYDRARRRHLSRWERRARRRSTTSRSRGSTGTSVVLDGGDRRKNGIVVHADGVSILNMSAHNFVENAFCWEGADRFRASYLTVWNVGEYGIYIEDGEEGVIDNDYVSGAARAAYYVGECRPCGATVSRSWRGCPRSGTPGRTQPGSTSATRSGIATEQGSCPTRTPTRRFRRRRERPSWATRHEERPRASADPDRRSRASSGSASRVAGGNENVISGNRVTGSERYGIAVFPTARFVVFDPAFRSPGHRGVRAATASRGTSSPAAAGPTSRWRRARETGTASPPTSLGGHCRAASRRPPARRVGEDGDASVAAELTRPVRVMFEQTISAVATRRPTRRCRLRLPSRTCLPARAIANRTRTRSAFPYSSHARA